MNADEQLVRNRRRLILTLICLSLLDQSRRTSGNNIYAESNLKRRVTQNMDGQ